MSDIPFTQYLMPNGRAVPVKIDRPDPVSSKAHAIIARGYSFECEMLTTGEVSFTITTDDGDEEVEICENGPEVLVRIDAMVNRFAKRLGIE